MGLQLICPHCQAKASLASRSCLHCGADLSRLPVEQRHYYVGRPEPENVVSTCLESPVVQSPSGEVFDEAALWYEDSEDDHLVPDAANVSLCEALDRILNKGAVVVGEVTISVANVDLIFLGLQLILTSIDTARELRSSSQLGASRGTAI
ncbi:MAG: gas vesicle protein [Syntrophobacterales bacterium]|nr:gas vesicle protein [Syntrophobacterales bacterium]